MRINVLLFGPLAQRLERDSVSVQTPEERPTAAGVLTALEHAEPSLIPLLSACKLAVNHTFAHDQTPINEGDEVAVIGLVSGG
jgi:sulfur-carrier protein